MKKTISAVLGSLLFLSSVHAFAEIISHDYGHFKLWIDCDRRSAIKFDYTLSEDTGNLSRPSSFSSDPNVPARCQQTSTSSYASVRSGYDRGHLVMSNHMDFSSTALTRANYMTNISPQVSTMNQGAWLKTEEISECYRDITHVRNIGGPLWSAGVMNSYFLNSHGVHTPRKYWKVLIKQDSQGNVIDAIGWIIPNATTATKSNLDAYLESISNIEAQSGQTIPVPAEFKHMIPTRSWSIPSGCDLS